MPTLSFLPTNKAFEEPDTTHFNQQKDAYISTLAYNYQTQLIKDKWLLLKNAFIQTLPSAQAEAFSKFYQDRLDTEDSSNVVKLSQMVDYFETFYFLYMTDDSSYQLDSNQKNLFINEIMTGFGEACEPGKQQRFENAIRFYRRDLSWVNGILYQMRHQALTTMHDAYNEYAAVSDIYAVHTLKVMGYIAQRMQLGITTEQNISDIFLTVEDERKIKQYFTKRYQNIFYLSYPEQCVENLKQHCLLEISKLLKNTEHQLDISSWQRDNINLKTPLCFNELRNLLELLFPNQNPIADMVEYDDNNIILLKRELVEVALEKAILAKLKKERFIFDINDVSTNKKNYNKHLHSYYHSDVKEMRQFQIEFQNINSDNEIQQRILFYKNRQLIVKYPNLILDKLINQPHLLYLLPKEVSIDPEFQIAAVQQLSQALLDDTTHKQEELIDVLSYLCKNDNALVQYLVPESFNHRMLLLSLAKYGCQKLVLYAQDLTSDDSLMLEMIKQDPFTILFAEPQVKKDLELIQAASAQLNLGLVNTYQEFEIRLQQQYTEHYQSYTTELHLALDLKSPEQPLDYDSLRKVRCYQTLMQDKTFSSSELSFYLKELSPKALLLIIEKRQQLSLSPLPFCNKSVLEDFIISFDNESQFSQQHSNISYSQWSLNGFSQIRRNIKEVLFASEKPYYGSSNYYHLKRLDSLLKHRCWYDGFIDYQIKHPSPNQAFSGMLSVLLQLKTSTRTLLEASFYLVQYLASISLLIGAYFFYGAASGFIFSSTPLTCLLLATAMISWVFDPPENLILEFMYQASRYANLFLIELFIPFNTTIALFSKLGEIFEVFRVEYDLLVNAFMPLYQRTKATLAADIKTNCFTKIERIIQELKAENTTSAHLKAELLSSIWHLVLKDFESSTQDDVTLIELLSKHYEIDHPEFKQVNCSFMDVAKTHRTSEHSFTLATPAKTWCGLFNRHTATEQKLKQAFNTDLALEQLETPGNSSF